MNDADTTPKTNHDWRRADAMTDAQVHAAAIADPDAHLMTDEEFARAQKIPRLKIIRRALGLTQEEFAARYQIPLGTLRDWEQGAKQPDQAARAYLRAIPPTGVKHARAAIPRRDPCQRRQTRKMRFLPPRGGGFGEADGGGRVRPGPKPPSWHKRRQAAPDVAAAREHQQKRKQFFFEKKNQKTFANCRRRPGRIVGWKSEATSTTPASHATLADRARRNLTNDADTTSKTNHDWRRADAMTEAQLHAAAIADPDAHPMTNEEFARAEKIPRLKSIRHALGLTQEGCAARYQIRLGTLCNWQQGCQAARPTRPNSLQSRTRRLAVTTAFGHMLSR